MQTEKEDSQKNSQATKFKEKEQSTSTTDEVYLQINAFSFQKNFKSLIGHFKEIKEISATQHLE
jgi:hypothetical protein